MASSVLAPATVDYPSSDGTPVAESDFQLTPLAYAREALRDYYRDRRDVYVAANLFIYYEEGDRDAAVAPDVFVVLGAPGHERQSYRLWEEPKGPDFVLEVTSRRTCGRTRPQAEAVRESWREGVLAVRPDRGPSATAAAGAASGGRQVPADSGTGVGRGQAGAVQQGARAGVAGDGAWLSLPTTRSRAATCCRSPSTAKRGSGPSRSGRGNVRRGSGRNGDGNGPSRSGNRPSTRAGRRRREWPNSKPGCATAATPSGKAAGNGYPLGPRPRRA